MSKPLSELMLVCLFRAICTVGPIHAEARIRLKIDDLSTVFLLLEISKNHRGRDLDRREDDLVESAHQT